MGRRDEDYIEQIAIESAKYTIANNSTIRQTARHMGVSKSTVHKDLKIRLKEISRSLYEDVSVVLEVNWEEKYIRGGIATKKKHEKLRK